MASIQLRGITKAFSNTSVLKGIDLSVEDGEFLTLVGPSGCGKSTLIRIIAGLEAQDGGSVLIGGAGVDHLRPHERLVAMVFQSYALYPHMSVRGNLALPLVMSRLRFWERLPLVRLFSSRRRAAMREIDGEVEGVARQLELDRLLDRRPAQLSGGQRQRVALGRAMVRHPRAFLMDEPLSNLDAKLRVHMRTELAELHERLGATFVYVTHDQVEAMTMSDRVAMMDSGEILQLGTPSELYEQPSSIKVAQFVGSPTIHLVPGRIGATGVVELFGRSLRLATALEPGEEVTIGIRPEALSVSSSEAAGAASFAARVGRRENLGSEYILHFEVSGERAIPVTVRAPAATASALQGTSTVWLAFDEAACHVFGHDGWRLESQVPEAERIAPLPVRALV